MRYCCTHRNQLLSTNNTLPKIDLQSHESKKVAFDQSKSSKKSPRKHNLVLDEHCLMEVLHSDQNWERTVLPAVLYERRTAP